jgi:hypothetical protein
MARESSAKSEDFPPPKPAVKSSISVVPLFRQESFLRQKYEVEGLSIGQIADQIFSAKSTVAKYLEAFEIAKRSSPPARKGQLGFGEKVSKGRLMRQMAEADAVAAMIRLRSEGYSLREIGAWLDAKGVKTKNQCGRWQAATILKILNRMKGDST